MQLWLAVLLLASRLLRSGRLDGAALAFLAGCLKGSALNWLKRPGAAGACCCSMQNVA